MRERLVAAFVGLTIVVVALYGIPRAYFLADLIRTQEQEQVDRMATVVAVAIDERRAAGAPVDTAFLSRLTSSGNAIAVRSAAGDLVGSIDTTREQDDDLTAERGLADGGSVMVTRSAETVGDDIAQALLPLVLIGLVLVVLAGIVGVAIARRLSRPFQDLAVAARGLGTGALTPDLPSYRVPEAQAISEALRTSGAKLDALLEHERELAALASHELRTPVTALRLELEDLAQWPETTPAVAAELRRSVEELDRLSSAITALLDRAREQSASAAIDLDLDALVAETVAGLVADGQQVEHTSGGLMPTRLDPAPVAEVVELLVRGAEPTHLSTHAQASHYEVRIRTGSGEHSSWDEAVVLAAGAGGQLTRENDGTALLRLPKRPLGSTKVPDGGREGSR